MPRFAQRISQHRQAVLEPDSSAGAEHLQPERCDVDVLLHSRIRRVEHLKPTVHQEAVDHVGAYAPPDLVGRVHDLHLDARALQDGRAHQPSQSGADHDDFSIANGDLRIANGDLTAAHEASALPGRGESSDRFCSSPAIAHRTVAAPRWPSGWATQRATTSGIGRPNISRDHVGSNATPPAAKAP